MEAKKDWVLCRKKLHMDLTVVRSPGRSTEERNLTKEANRWEGFEGLNEEFAEVIILE